MTPFDDLFIRFSVYVFTSGGEGLTQRFLPLPASALLFHISFTLSNDLNRLIRQKQKQKRTCKKARHSAVPLLCRQAWGQQRLILYTSLLVSTPQPYNKLQQHVVEETATWLLCITHDTYILTRRSIPRI